MWLLTIKWMGMTIQKSFYWVSFITITTFIWLLLCCINKYLTRSLFAENTLLQYTYTDVALPHCMYLYVFSMRIIWKVLSLILQFYGFSPVCVITWAFNYCESHIIRSTFIWIFFITCPYMTFYIGNLFVSNITIYTLILLVTSVSF